MSSIQVQVDGDVEKLLKKLDTISNVNKKSILTAIGEGLRTSTHDRFLEERSPEGKQWTPSIRARERNAKTLTDTTKLKTSISTKADSTSVAVGTNDIRAATLQYGDTRTIRARNAKYLSFKVSGQWKKAKEVTIKIPARPFLGMSDEDLEDVKETLESIFEEN